MNDKQDWKSEYDLAERENDNLRSALAWAANHLTVAEKDELEKRLDATIEEGGVTGNGREDDLHKATQVLLNLAAHVESLLIGDPEKVLNRPYWLARLDHLINIAREFEEKHPLMRRLGGHPNTFVIIKKNPS
jgi:hypothetical protein